MQSLNGSPQILLRVSAKNLTGVRDEVCHIEEPFVWCAGVVELDDRAGYDIDVTFLRKVLIALQVLLPVRAGLLELWIVGYPVKKMVLGKYGKMCVLLCGGSDVFAGRVEVSLGLHWLERSVMMDVEKLQATEIPCNTFE